MLTVASFSVWYWVLRGPRDDLGRLQGDWKLSILGRRPVEGEDERPPVAVRIAGDHWQYYVGGKAGKAFKITLHEHTTPKEIELTLLDASGNPIGKYESHGVYAIDEDKGGVRLLVEPVNRPRPTDLDDHKANVWVLTPVRLELKEVREK